MQINKLNTNQKSKQPKIQQNKNYPGSVASYNTRPGNEVGLFYNAPEPTLLQRLPALFLLANELRGLTRSRGWWRGTVVERLSLAGELSLSCARPAADG